MFGHSYRATLPASTAPLIIAIIWLTASSCIALGQWNFPTTLPGSPAPLHVEKGALDQGPFSLVLLAQNNCQPAVYRSKGMASAAPYRDLPYVAFSLGFKCTNQPTEVTIDEPAADGRYLYPIGKATLAVEILTYADTPDQPAFQPPGVFIGPRYHARIPNQHRPGERGELCPQKNGMVRELEMWWIPPKGHKEPFVPDYLIESGCRGTIPTPGKLSRTIQTIVLVPLGSSAQTTFTVQPLKQNGAPVGKIVQLEPRKDLGELFIVHIPGCYSPDTAKMRFTATSNANPAQKAQWIVSKLPHIAPQFTQPRTANFAIIGGVKVQADAALSSDITGIREIGVDQPERKFRNMTLNRPFDIVTHDRTGIPTIRCVFRVAPRDHAGAPWFCTVESIKPRWALQAKTPGPHPWLEPSRRPGTSIGPGENYCLDAETVGAFPGQRQDVQISGMVGPATKHTEYVTLNVATIDYQPEYPRGVIVWAGHQVVTTSSGLKVTALFEQQARSGAKEPHSTGRLTGASAFVAVRFPDCAHSTTIDSTTGTFGLYRFVEAQAPFTDQGAYELDGWDDLGIWPPAAFSLSHFLSRKTVARMHRLPLDSVPYRVGIDKPIEDTDITTPGRMTQPEQITLAISYYTTNATRFSLVVPVRDRFPNGLNPDDFDSRYRETRGPD